jgi:hypothetical protein
LKKISNCRIAPAVSNKYNISTNQSAIHMSIELSWHQMKNGVFMMENSMEIKEKRSEERYNYKIPEFVYAEFKVGKESTKYMT